MRTRGSIARFTKKKPSSEPIKQRTSHNQKSLWRRAAGMGLCTQRLRRRPEHACAVTSWKHAHQPQLARKASEVNSFFAEGVASSLSSQGAWRLRSLRRRAGNPRYGVSRDFRTTLSPPIAGLRDVDTCWPCLSLSVIQLLQT